MVYSVRLGVGVGYVFRDACAYLVGVGSMSDLDALKAEYKALVEMCENLRRHVVLEVEVYNKIGPVLVDYAVVDKDPLYVLKKHIKMEKRRKTWL